MSEQILDGIRVLELGQLIAGPFASKTLADFGAEVIKVESPEAGDPLRKWRMLRNGTSVWWQAQSRNKQSVCIDLRSVDGQALVHQLAVDADVVIENFRPGTLEKWGLGWDALHRLNPRLIMLRVSGYGQSGPKRDEPGFGAVGEAMGGLRHITGELGRPPVRAGVSLGDTLAGLHGALGVLLALYQRDAKGGEGQMIDVALYESVFNMTESLLPEYSAFGVSRAPAGGALPGIAPSNAYPCANGEYILIAGNGDSIFRRLMQLIDRLDLGDAPDLAGNDGRVARAQELDAAIGAWTARLMPDEALTRLKDAGVPAGRIYNAQDIAEDPHYRARGIIERVRDADGLEVDVPGVVPKLSANPGRIRFRAPVLGEHTESAMRRMGLTSEDIKRLRGKRVIA
ncbi:CaiB/BaiF CoA transferase family protein [Pandoraea cepalis]|uniref:CoA transferase n=1 Tax=Pandoraea cepalis TaxID=2508294 RepID=A0A5E4VMC2_9BURK|nr:CoA transferase [Pandoraea cepalis]VVE13351.1 coA transferase [Pandoraea cepalis]